MRCGAKYVKVPGEEMEPEFQNETLASRASTDHMGGCKLQGLDNTAQRIK